MCQLTFSVQHRTAKLSGLKQQLLFSICGCDLAGCFFGSGQSVALSPALAHGTLVSWKIGSGLADRR